ncbi:hypothetical protein [Pseudomonas huanghezhanensis]|uniref:hypothetical protein n=1 Tax=Pseudomonas huanghezhanensis TaxID=3002903 RepID=UPI0022854EB5|nr:hypothetical protein [Pseudomonas sp. BSw22131]
MSTIYDPDARTVKQISLVILIFSLFLGLIGVCRLPGDGWVYGLLSVVVFVYMLYLRYWCESYTVFALSYFTLMIFLLALAPAWVSYTVVTDELGRSRLEGGGVACLLFGFIAILYGVIYLTPTQKFPFDIVGNKVASAASNTSSLKWGVIAGLGTLVAGSVIRSVTPFTTSILIILLFAFGCIATLIHARDRIRGLRTLRMQQKTMPVPYTFMQIDEIREARSRCWIRRLFKWVASWRKSSGI